LPVWILGINSRNATVLGGNKFGVAPKQWSCVTSSFSLSEPQHNSKRVPGRPYLRQVTRVGAFQQAIVWFTSCPVESFKGELFLPPGDMRGGIQVDDYARSVGFTGIPLLI